MIRHSQSIVIQQPLSQRICCSKGFGPNPKPPPPPKSRKRKGSGRGIEYVETSKSVTKTKDASSTPVEVPSYVANRVLGRIVIFSGVPVFLGIALLPFFYYLKAVKKIDIPTSLVYLIQTFTFGGGLFGISYAILSSSVSNQDDFIGFETFKSNVQSLIKGEK